MGLALPVGIWLSMWLGMPVRLGPRLRPRPAPRLWRWLCTGVYLVLCLALARQRTPSLPIRETLRRNFRKRYDKSSALQKIPQFKTAFQKYYSGAIASREDLHFGGYRRVAHLKTESRRRQGDPTPPLPGTSCILNSGSRTLSKTVLGATAPTSSLQNRQAFYGRDVPPPRYFYFFGSFTTVYSTQSL